MFVALFALCFSATRARVSTHKTQNGIACTMCSSIVKYVEQIMVDAKTEEQIATLTKQLCTKFPVPYDTLCVALADQYIPMIMEYLEQGLEHLDVCTKLGFCGKTRQANGFKANAFTCTLCQTVVKMIEEVMVDTKVEADIQAVVGKLCAKFPSPYNTLCQSLVGQYVPTIMEYLEQGLEHLNVCQKIALCPKTQQARNGMHANSVTCTICTTIIGYAEELLLAKKTQDEIISALNKVCTKFPVPYNTLCQGVVAQYIPMIIQYLEQGIEKAEICKKIHMCGKTADLARNGWKPTPLSCSICTTIVKYVEETMTSQEVVDQVDFLVVKLCKKLPSGYAELCETVVTNNIPAIIKYLEEGVEKLNICAKVQMCEKRVARNGRSHGHRVRIVKSNGFMCNLCTQLVDKVIEVLKDTTVEAEVIAAAEKLCAKFPVPYDTLCNTLVEQYVPSIIEWASQGLQSAEICKKIKLCTDGKQKETRVRSANGFKANAITCTVCQTIITYVEQIMVDTRVESEIQAQLSKLCAKFPVPYDTLCTTLVGQYIPMILQYLEQGLAKSEVCKKIKLCA